MKLSYFPIPALGEPIRLILELSGAEWEDNRMAFADWGEFKPKTKWGQMPVLHTADGVEMTQTKPLVRYLGAKVSVGGASPPPPAPSATMHDTHTKTSLHYYMSFRDLHLCSSLFFWVGGSFREK